MRQGEGCRRTVISNGGDVADIGGDDGPGGGVDEVCPWGAGAGFGIPRARGEGGWCWGWCWGSEKGGDEDRRGDDAEEEEAGEHYFSREVRLMNGWWVAYLSWRLKEVLDLQVKSSWKKSNRCVFCKGRKDGIGKYI